jgi:PhnB protein
MSDNKATIMPFLIVKEGHKAIDFYVAALGAVIMERYEMADHKISAKLAIGGAVFCMGDEEPNFGNFAPEVNASNPVRIVLQTKDADRLYEKAINCGAEVICPMTTEEDWRIGKLRDPFGHIWEIGYVL